ncbi:SagB/ThcOx family dehydrogenase [bacterium]|nr:SagB/ThcOx family dehydrogenase [bacterium]
MCRTTVKTCLMIENGHQYQWLTAYTRGRMSGHRLDWSKQPVFFKNYSPCTSYTLPLPSPESFLQSSLSDVIKKELQTSSDSSEIATKHLTLNDIATLLLLTSSLTAKSTFAQGEIWYRSNASAGALYPVEFYLAFPGADDLPAGLYHYDLLKPGLNLLRQNPRLKEFFGACHPQNKTFADSAGSATLIISTLFFRTAWKYQNRAYRYLLLDCGHALENLALALQFMEIGFEIVLNFDDSTINKNLNLEEQREVGLVAVRLQAKSLTVSETPVDHDPELISQHPPAEEEVEYPCLNEIHQSTSLPRLNNAPQISHAKLGQGILNWHKIPDNIIPPQSSLTYVESLSRRRSRRNFIKKRVSLSSEYLYILIDLLLDETLETTFLRPEILFFAADIGGFADGLYLLDLNRRRFALLDNHDRRAELAAAALNQRWLAQAALQFIFVADLEFAEKIHGPRSYRYLNINAGRLGQRLYLGATSLNLGCCGVGAFYDRELAEIC